MNKNSENMARDQEQKAEIRRALDSMGVQFKPLDESGGGCCGTADQCCSTRPNIRALIDQRIEYHNRSAEGLHQLLRSIPQEMPRHAEDALADILLNSRPRY